MISIVLTLIICFSLSACSKEEKKVAVKTETLNGKLVLWSYGEQANALKLSADNFTKKNPGVEITLNIVSNEELSSKYDYSYTHGETIPDIVTVSDEYTKNFIYNNGYAISDSTKTMDKYKSQMLKWKLKNLTVNGIIYGFPYDASPYGVFYRRSVFENNGLSLEDFNTWNDYIESGKNIEILTGGSILPLNSEVSDEYLRLLTFQLKGSYYGKDNKVSLNSEKVQKATELIRSISKDKIACEFKSKEELKANVLNGNIDAFIAPYSEGLSIINSLPESLLTFGAMKIPSFENGGNRDVCMGGSNLIIMKGGKNINLAEKFAEFACTDTDNCKSVLKTVGIIPSYTPFYNDISFNAKEVKFKDEKIASLFLSVVKGSEGNSYDENMPLIMRTLSLNMKELISSEKDTNMLLQTYEDSISEKLQ